MTCPRCCKSNVGIHTCTPTEGWGRMEQEIERLRHDIERHIAIASEHATECERLRAENEALRRYANHTNDCNLSSIYQFVALRGCNCGFDALAAKGE